MKTLLITGGAGFIGSNFVKHWYNKYPNDKIIVLDNLTYAGNADNIPKSIRNNNKKFEFWYGNVNNGELVDSLVSISDIVIHFAAESHVARSIFDNKIFFETDVLGTQTIATAILKNYKTVERFIHISTSEVYGTANYEPMDEEHPLNPCSPYAAAKCGADRLVYSFIMTYDFPAVIVRPFNQYGPNQHLEKVVPRFITSALKKEKLTVHGDGKSRRDWLHVEDTCERLELIINTPLDKVKGEVFNIGSGESIQIIDIAKKILRELGRPESLITFIGDRPGQVECHVSSIEKAKQVFGMNSGRDFDTGLKQTIQWYQDNEDWWRRIEWMKNIKIKSKTGEWELH